MRERNISASILDLEKLRTETQQMVFRIWNLAIFFRENTLKTRHFDWIYGISINKNYHITWYFIWVIEIVSMPTYYHWIWSLRIKHKLDVILIEFIIGSNSEFREIDCSCIFYMKSALSIAYNEWRLSLQSVKIREIHCHAIFSSNQFYRKVLYVV